MNPTMSIKTFVEVATSMPPRQSMLLRGDHGIGKSQVVRKVRDMLAKKTGIQYGFIDRRLSQTTEGDLLGLPTVTGDSTKFNPPDWIKEACEKPMIVFLDELNRATPEVMQAAFQVVLDYELNGWQLHPETRCFAAVNSSTQYNVNEMDPALLDRFWVIDLAPTVEDWIEWAQSDGNISEIIIDFIRSDHKMLDTPKNVAPGEVARSRRSWELLNKALLHAGVMNDPKDNLFYQMCLGYLGTETTIAFTNFAKTYEFQLTGEEIANKYIQTGRKKFLRLSQMQRNDAIDKLAEYALKNLEKFDDNQQKNVRAFAEDLDDELKLSLWSKLVRDGTNKMGIATTTHAAIADLIVTGVFGVPMGEAGIGVQPNIPDFIKKDGTTG